MSDAERLFGDEHVRVYRETDGAVGHIWRRGSKIVLLTTSGRTTGEPRTVPLIYENAGDAYVVVASKGGADEHPGSGTGTCVQSRRSRYSCSATSSPRPPARQTARSERSSGAWRHSSGRTTTSTRRGPSGRSRSSSSSGPRCLIPNSRARAAGGCDTSPGDDRPRHVSPDMRRGRSSHQARSQPSPRTRLSGINHLAVTRPRRARGTAPSSLSAPDRRRAPCAPRTAG